MRTPLRSGLVVFPVVVLLGACSRSCGGTDDGASDAAARMADERGQADSGGDSGRALSPAADAAAARVVSPEARRAYAKAIGEGRRAQRQARSSEAIAAFSRALDAVPDDARAFAERGFARFQAHDYAAAKVDLDRASAGSSAKADPKLAAQIEFNLGLVCQAIADTDPGAKELKNVASAHFRRSNDLSPSAAAAARMVPCPVSVDAVGQRIFASLAEARADIEPDGGVLEEETADKTTYFTGAVELDNEEYTRLLLPVSRGRYAMVYTRAVLPARCGPDGDRSVTYADGLWTVVYQAQMMLNTTVDCSCSDETNKCPETWKSAEKPPCKCKEVACMESCVGGEDGSDSEGEHDETVIDSEGRGLLTWTTDYDLLGKVKTELDTKAMHFRATGLNCAVDIALPLDDDDDDGDGGADASDAGR